MYEELIKNLRKMENSENCVIVSVDGFPAMQFVKDAADAIEELCKSKWIPVTERLPEEEEVVLVWGGASVYTAKRHNKYGGLMWWKLNSKQHYCNPTHWMPLPEPPESEGE